MLLIEQVSDMDTVQSQHIKCPVCKHGRLCDRPINEQEITIAAHRKDSLKAGDYIILKCPKCSAKFRISFT